MSPPKYLQNVITDDPQLNRVQANVAEALRQIENRIVTAITTINTNIYNALNITTAGSPREWDFVQETTFTTQSNVVTPWIGYVVAPETIQVWNLTILGVSNNFSSAGDAAGFQRGAVFYRYNSGGPAQLLTTASFGGGSLIAAQAVISVLAGTPDQGTLSVAGQLAQPMNWKATIRRMVMGMSG